MLSPEELKILKEKIATAFIGNDQEQFKEGCDQLIKNDASLNLYTILCTIIIPENNLLSLLSYLFFHYDSSTDKARAFYSNCLNSLKNEDFSREGPHGDHLAFARILVNEDPQRIEESDLIKLILKKRKSIPEQDTPPYLVIDEPNSDPLSFRTTTQKGMAFGLFVSLIIVVAAYSGTHESDVLKKFLHDIANAICVYAFGASEETSKSVMTTARFGIFSLFTAANIGACGFAASKINPRKAGPQ